MTLDSPPALGSPIDPDRLTLDGVRAGALRGRSVTVLGLARSGIALTRFLSAAGARVTVYDRRTAAELVRAIDAIATPGPDLRLLLGPDVDPVVAWTGADLVTSSPSINPDFPTTEPRLRAELGELVHRRAAGDRTVPAVVWEPDLFLRLCPAPTIGITGTKGKTTTSALTHAILSADPGHPAILGGNMGVPIVERLPELTGDERVVFELSELQLPTLSRGTTVAVYTNVTEDHVDRHGSVEAYRRVKRRLAELVDPAGALVLNLDDPITSGYASGATARVVGYRLGDPPRGGLGVADGWIVADGVGRVLPIGELRIPGRHNVSNALAAIAVGVWFGLSPEAIRVAATAFEGVEHRLETVAVIDGVRFVNDSQGTQPDAVAAALRSFEPPIVLIAGGRTKGIDLSALASVVAERATAAVLIGESAPDLEDLFGAAGLATIEHAPTLEAAVERADGLAREAAASDAPVGGVCATVLLSPAAASFDMFSDYEARGLAFKAAVHALAARGKALMGIARWPLDRLGPLGRLGRWAPSPRAVGGRSRPDTRSGKRRASSGLETRAAARPHTDVLQRERHQPDYSILLAVVALVAIGILMVYSSSAMRAYVNQDDTLAIVGPQILWAAIGLVVLAIVMRIDYRILRLVSVPGYVLAVGLLVLVFVPSMNRVVGGSARWLVVGPLPAVHPAEIAKLALIVYLAHWLANKGTRIADLRGGTIPFLLIVAPIVLLVMREPDLGTTIVIGATAFTMFFVAGASVWQFLAVTATGVLGGALFMLRGYQLDRIRAWLDPWADPLGSGFHTIQGLLALGLGGILGTGLGESKLAGGLYLPNAWNDFIFAIIGEEFGFLGAAAVIALFGILAIAGIRTAMRAPDTFGSLLAAGITAWLCIQAFVNIGVVVALLPVTGITLPFISAGGSSLVVSFAAVGVLLSISRETLEADASRRDETRTTDGVGHAPADRGRGHGGPHLPGPRRRDLAPAPRQRA